MSSNFTPTQLAMLAVLADGFAHPRSEIIACIDDPEPSNGQFKQALHRLRQKLKPHGQSVHCGIRNRRIVFRLVGLVGKAAE